MTKLSEILPGSFSSKPPSFVRKHVSVTVNNLASDASEETSINLSRSFTILKLEVSHKCWVRFYLNGSSRTADELREIDSDPDPGVGLIAEFVSTEAETILATPGVVGYNDESPVTSVCPIRITNLEDSTEDITITVTYLPMG